MESDAAALWARQPCRTVIGLRHHGIGLNGARGYTSQASPRKKAQQD
jgi:hypothetical protein